MAPTTVSRSTRTVLERLSASTSAMPPYNVTDDATCPDGKLEVAYVVPTVGTGGRSRPMMTDVVKYNSFSPPTARARNTGAATFVLIRQAATMATSNTTGTVIVSANHMPPSAHPSRAEVRWSTNQRTTSRSQRTTRPSSNGPTSRRPAAVTTTNSATQVQT